jgi:hypothetical protein
MMTPPRTDMARPSRLTPPFVPGGQGRKVVIKMGDREERMPSSDARVSPRQVAKWLFDDDCRLSGKKPSVAAQ